jgi:hypothetical protein
VFFVTFQWLAELRKKPVVIAAAAPVNGTSTHAVPGNDTTAHGIHAGGSASARG